MAEVQSFGSNGLIAWRRTASYSSRVKAGSRVIPRWARMIPSSAPRLGRDDRLGDQPPELRLEMPGIRGVLPGDRVAEPIGQHDHRGLDDQGELGRTAPDRGLDSWRDPATEQGQLASGGPEGELGPRRPLRMSRMERLPDPVDLGKGITDPAATERGAHGVHEPDFMGIAHL
jgi:hypothetical protein